MADFIDIDESRKSEFNSVVNHPMQSYEWGEFRKKTGVKVIRRGLISNGKIIDGFTLTLHKIPRTKYYIGYLPKGNEPTLHLTEDLNRIGREENCIFIQLEPNVTGSLKSEVLSLKSLRSATHPLFTKYTFVLDLTKTEDELLSQMHSKTRYNIRVAEKHKVKVVEETNEKSFEQYLRLMTETTNRQGFYAHTPTYHKQLFETLNDKQGTKDQVSYHIFNATYESKVLTSWVLLVFHDTLYYPYGASSRENREVMANNLMAWEVVKFGKKRGLKKFDMWGALGPEPDKNDPWYGFHRFKEGYGAELVEFVGSYDLVIKTAIYEAYKIADKLRWTLLKLKNRIK